LSLVAVLAGGCAGGGREVSRHRAHASAIVDDDCDGIPTEIEDDLKLDPFDPADGDDDRDDDGVPTAIEVRLGGDPEARDTDGNGVDDDKDLATPLDLDGDGFPTWSDVCPEDVDVDQRDYDGDGVGDACDPDPMDAGEQVDQLVIHEAYDATTGDWGVRPEGHESSARMLGDRAGLLATGPSFRLLRTPLYDGVVSVPLREVYHPEWKDHAYAIWEHHVALIREGYEDLGVIGYLTEEPLPFGASVEVRRFHRPADDHEAIAADPVTVDRLLADGYVELETLGFALVDEGRLRKPAPVLRSRETDPVEQVRHHRRLILDLGADSEGQKFRVWPERLGNALPLHRLRDPSGFEVLSTDAGEVDSLVAGGHALEGILGWVLTDGSAMPPYEMWELWRLEDGTGRHVYAADPAELEELVVGGPYEQTVRLGFVAASTARGEACAGPTAVDRLETQLGEIDEPGDRARVTFSAVFASCAILRMLDGNAPATEYEQHVAARLPVDPEGRRLLRARMQPFQDLDPGFRAAALGELAPLVPSSCASPVDLAALGEQAQNLLFTYEGPPPSLREEFCEGTLYADDDPAHATPDEERAITIDARNGGEIATTNRARPALMGVLASPVVRGHSAIEAAAAANAAVGYPLEGVPTGQVCTNDAGCDPLSGMKCVSSECRAFPIVRTGFAQTFSGVNMWDVIDGQIAFRDVVTGEVTRVPDTITANEPDDAARCDLYGTPHNHAVIDEVPLAPGRFYEVIAINTNGNFFERGETVPVGEDEARAAGRTIHVCWDAADPFRPADTIADCEPVASPEAECMLDGPLCSATTGGRWGLVSGQQPRSLEVCSAPGMECGETPREFASDGGVPRYVFVEVEPPKRKVTATAQGVTCREETGWDRLGSDELVVHLIEFWPHRGDGAALVGGNAFMTAMDTGDRIHHVGHGFGSMALPHVAGDEGKGVFMLHLFEDDTDAFHFAMLEGVFILLWEAVTLPFSGHFWDTVSDFGVIKLMHYIAVTGNNPENEELGRTLWLGTVDDVVTRGMSSHDAVLNELAVIAPFDPELDMFVADHEVSVHPSVDNDVYGENADLIACSGLAECPSGWSCHVGACVSPSWTDAEPGVPGQPPGYIERREFINGDDSHYEVYIGWHIE
jgi:hypothetical protein